MRPTTYEIHIDGHVPPDEYEEFVGMEAVEESRGTVLRGIVRDQAALTGLVDRVEALGLRVREVRELHKGETSGGSAT